MAAFELQGGDLVVEEGRVVGEMPGERLVLDAGEAGQEASDDGGTPGPGAALEAGLIAGEGVPEGGADGLVDAAFRAASEGGLGEVAVVDVAREDEDGGWRVAPLPSGYGPDRVDNSHEGVVEGGPMVEVLGAADVLGPNATP